MEQKSKEEVYRALKKTILSGRNYNVMGLGTTTFGIRHEDSSFVLGGGLWENKKSKLLV